MISGVVGKVGGRVALNYGGDPIVNATIIGIFGGIASEATGGEFYEGAMRAAFVYLYNDRMSKYELELMRKQAAARASAYEKAFGEKAHSYMFDKPTTAIAVYNIGSYAILFGGGIYFKVGELYGFASKAAITAGAVGTATGASIGYESYKGLGVSDPEEFIESNIQNYIKSFIEK